jgi:hypothetical protein
MNILIGKETINLTWSFLGCRRKKLRTKDGQKLYKGRMSVISGITLKLKALQMV